MTPRSSSSRATSFTPESTSDLAKFIAATLEHLPTLRDQIAVFTKNARHRFIVLPGTSDHELANNQFARDHLEALGVTFANDLILQVATPTACANSRSRP